MSSVTPAQKKLLIALGLVLTVVWARALTVRPARSGRTPKPAATAPRVTLEQPAEPPRAAAYRHTDWGENPFLSDRHREPQRVSMPSGSSTNYVLGGILWDPRSPSAVVNNRVVSVGDFIGPWKVMEIRRDRVVLSDGTSTQILEVH